MTQVTFGQYGKHFQECVVQALLCDQQWAQQMLEVFDVEYLELKYLKLLASKYFDYAKKYKSFPTMMLLVTIIKDELKIGTDILLRDQIIDYLTRIKASTDNSDLLFVKEKSLDFCRKQALKKALEDAVDKIAADKYEQIVDDIKKAVSVGIMPSLGHNFAIDYEQRFVEVNRNPVPTGISVLDQQGILSGGLGVGELGCVMGATGAGKCVSSSTKINIKYTGIKINGVLYKPWEIINTKRGKIYARDITQSDEIV